MEALIYKPTTASAVEFSEAGRLEEWIHLFLQNEGNNLEFSEGLKLAPRNYYAPVMMTLNEFQRCCGPEASMKYKISEGGFNKRVDKIAEKYIKCDWDMPPLIIQREENIYVLCDGNHRYEALKKLGISEYWVIIWETAKEDIMIN